MSLDIDGTMEVGDPPGPLSLEFMRAARARGFVVGSSSDRILLDQRRLWVANSVEVDFVSHKHDLPAIARDFRCDRCIHIGDTLIDERYALMAGFKFWHVDQVSGLNFLLSHLA